MCKVNVGASYCFEYHVITEDLMIPPTQIGNSCPTVLVSSLQDILVCAKIVLNMLFHIIYTKPCQSL